MRANTVIASADILTTDDITAGDDLFVTDSAYIGDDLVVVGPVKAEYFESASTTGLRYYDDADTYISFPALDNIRITSGDIIMMEFTEAANDSVVLFVNLIPNVGSTMNLGNSNQDFNDIFSDAAHIGFLYNCDTIDIHGDTLFFRDYDDAYAVKFQMTENYFGAPGFGALYNVDATSTVPNLLPEVNDNNTGIGAVADDALSLIAGGTEFLRITKGGTDSITVFGDMVPEDIYSRFGQPYNPWNRIYVDSVIIGDTKISDNGSQGVIYNDDVQVALFDENYLQVGDAFISNHDQMSYPNKPAYSFGGDENTGLGSDGDDKLYLIVDNAKYFQMQQDSTTVLKKLAPSGTVDIGSDGNRFDDLWVNTLHATSGSSQWTLSGDSIYPTTAVKIVPTGTIDLGSNNNRFDDIYTTDLFASGSIGIGTTNPKLKLHIATQYPLALTTADFVNNTTGSMIGFGFGTASGNTYGFIQSGISGDASVGNLSLQPSGGNIGIKTTTPYYDLEVVGGIKSDTVTTLAVTSTRDSLIVLKNLTPSGTVDLGSQYNAFDDVWGKLRYTNNLMIGLNAGTDIAADGDNNIFIGESAGANTTTGDENVFIGRDAGITNITTDGNTFIGYQAGYTSNGGTYNVGVGHATLRSMTTGSSNTALGYKAGFGITDAVGDITIGDHAGHSLVSDAHTEAIGYQQARLATSSNSIYIGTNAGEN